MEEDHYEKMGDFFGYADAVAPKTGVADNTALLVLSTGSAVLGAYALRKAGKAE